MPPSTLTAPDGLLRAPLFRQLLVAVVVALAIVQWTPGELVVARWLPSATAIAYAAAAVVLVIHLRRHPSFALRLLGPAPATRAVALCTAAVPIFAVTVGAALLIRSIGPAGQPPSRALPAAIIVTLDGVPPWAAWVMHATGTVLMAPVVEEVVFRVILYQRCARRWGPERGAIAAALGFALCHGEWLGHFLAAMILTGLVIQTGSLRVPIIVHAAWNALALVLFAWVPALAPADLPHASAGPPLSTTGALLVLCAGAGLLYLYWKVVLDGKSPGALMTRTA